jgi:glycosyltransferase involved in cell wall biosynthesis
MVVLEAQACGLPAIVSDVGGPKEIIQNGHTGFIAKAGSVEDWVAAIENIIQLKRQYSHLYQELRSNAQLRVRVNFEWSRVLKSIFETSAPRDESCPINDSNSDFSFLPHTGIVGFDALVLQ